MHNIQPYHKIALHSTVRVRLVCVCVHTRACVCVHTTDQTVSTVQMVQGLADVTQELPLLGVYLKFEF